MDPNQEQNPQAGTQPPEVPAEESAISDVNEWADFAADTDDDAASIEGEFEVTEPAGDEPPQAPVEQTPEIVPPVEAQPVAVQTPAPVVSEPVAAAPVPQAPAQPTPALDYNTWRGQQLGNLEKQYALDEDSARALLTEPETILPKLAAQVHLEVTESVLRAVQNLVPGMIQSVTHNTEIESKAQNEFFSANPDLKGVDQSKILQIGAMFRQVNPNASANVAISTIGSMVRTALGLPALGPADQGAIQQTPAVAPVQPFVPVRGGGGGTAPRSPAQANPWQELIDIDD